MDITVVGAGVVGLTVALVLEEQGHRVRIVADAPTHAITSSVAGAVWLPYRVGPPAAVAAWGARTLAWLEEIASDRAAGVDVLTGYEITPDAGPSAPRPWWDPRDAARPLVRTAVPVSGAPIAWRFVAPRAEPRLHLAWLAARLRAPIELRTVTALEREPGDAVIHCTGIGARTLVGDTAVEPLFGQTVITEPGTVDLGITITDNRDPAGIFYVIPRRAELVLGGCSLPWPPGAPPVADAAITDRILAQAARLGVRHGTVRAVRVGLRPYRPEVRLERDPIESRVIHCYGHGGAGYTLARGCAEDVAALVTAA